MTNLQTELLRAACEIMIELNESVDDRVYIDGEWLDEGHARDVALTIMYAALRGEELGGRWKRAADERLAQLPAMGTSANQAALDLIRLQEAARDLLRAIGEVKNPGTLWSGDRFCKAHNLVATMVGL